MRRCLLARCIIRKRDRAVALFGDGKQDLSRRRWQSYLHPLTHLLASDSELPDRYGDGCFSFLFLFCFGCVIVLGWTSPLRSLISVREFSRGQGQNGKERERILTVGLVDAAPRTADGRVCSERFFFLLRLLLLVSSLLAFACSLFLQRSPGWLPSLFM